MSWLRKLFGLGTAPERPAPEKSVAYKGCLIRATPYLEGGQYQTAGTIEKDFPSGTREYRFVRAERHASKDEAASFAITKGRQIIDEQGDRMFDAR